MESELTIANLAKVKAISEEDVYVTRRYSVKGDKSTMKELEKEYTYILLVFIQQHLKDTLEPNKKSTIWNRKPPFKYFYLNKKLFPHKILNDGFRYCMVPFFN